MNENVEDAPAATFLQRLFTEKKNWMITDIIFDFFGTLVSYSSQRIDANFAQSHAFIRANGFDISYTDFVQGWDSSFSRLEVEAKKTFVEFHMQDVARVFFEDVFGCEVDDEIAQQLVAVYLAEWNVGVTYFAEIRPFLQRLSQNYRLSLISNTHYRPLVLDHLKQMGIADLFAVITLSVDHGLRKPHPKIFEDTLRELGITPQQALYVGDSFAADYEGAKNIQMKAVLIDAQRKNDRPEFVGHLFDLERYLAGS